MKEIRKKKLIRNHQACTRIGRGNNVPERKGRRLPKTPCRIESPKAYVDGETERRGAKGRRKGSGVNQWAKPPRC